VFAKPIAVAFHTAGNEGAGPGRATAASAADRHELGMARIAPVPFLVLTASGRGGLGKTKEPAWRARRAGLQVQEQERTGTGTYRPATFPC